MTEEEAGTQNTYALVKGTGVRRPQLPFGPLPFYTQCVVFSMVTNHFHHCLINAFSFVQCSYSVVTGQSTVLRKQVEKYYLVLEE